MKPRALGCIPCEIVAGKRVEPGGTLYEDKFWHVGSALAPVVWKGFTIVKLKRHCAHIADLTPAESAALGPILQAGSRALMETLHPAKVFICSFGDGIKHIHFWLLPRPTHIRPGMHPVMFELDLRTTLTRAFGWKRWLVPPQEIEATAAALRDRLNQLLPPAQGS